MKVLPEEKSQREETHRLKFKGKITQMLPGGRGGFVTFDEPLKSANRGFFRASLIEEGYEALQKTGATVEGEALANGAIVAEVVELHLRSDE